MTGPFDDSTAVPHTGESSVDVSALFRLAWLDDEPAPADYEFLPARLARAARDVLKVDGATIGVLDDYFRVPLGASDEDARRTERLEFTIGEGPCLEAVMTRRPVCVATDQIRKRWPLFARQLFDHTPYQAVMSFPIGHAEVSLGALDLFLIDPDRLGAVSAADAIAVVEAIHATLVITGSPAPGPLSGKPEPRWLHGQTSQSRLAVWIAVGELMAAFDITDRDALALLRAHAYSHSETVDDTARQLNDGALEPANFTP